MCQMVYKQFEGVTRRQNLVTSLFFLHGIGPLLCAEAYQLAQYDSFRIFLVNIASQLQTAANGAHQSSMDKQSELPRHIVAAVFKELLKEISAPQVDSVSLF